MLLAVLWTLSCLWPPGLTLTQYDCENDAMYAELGICTVTNVNLEKIGTLTDISFPEEAHIVFSNANIRSVEPELFQMLELTEILSFRNGFVRSVLFQSSELRILQIINTGLTDFDTLGEPNYSLQELYIRSKVFSRWQPSISQLRALVVVDISHCNFSYLSLDWFQSFSKLRVLDVSNNNLLMIHSSPMVKLTALEELYLASNRLQHLWRFPDAFPNLTVVTLSDNSWLCDWVTMARDTIWILNIVSLDTDYECYKGWVLNGGLCCRKSWVTSINDGERNNGTRESNIAENNNSGNLQPSTHSTEPQNNLDVQVTKLDIILVEGSNETEELVAGVEMNNITVFVDVPLPLD